MKSIKGRYNGRVVVLDEPAPVSHEVEVTVQFPDVVEEELAVPSPRRQWRWEESRRVAQSPEGAASDEVRRQRDLD